MNFIDSALFALDRFDLGLAVVIFFAYAVVDALYARYTLYVTEYREFSAATIGALMHFILAFGIFNYIQNFLYVVPVAAGSWVGTFFIIRQERLKKIKLTEVK